MGILIAVLAAGASKRMGTQKLRLPLKDEVPMLRRVVQVAIAGGSDGVVVVTRGDMSDVLDGLPIIHVVNAQAEDGQSTSVHAAVREVMTRDGNAVLFLLGDEPEIEVGVVQHMVRRWRAEQPLLAQARYNDGFGHPVVFSAELFDELLACTGDEGGRRVVQQHRDERLVVAVAADGPKDIDTRDAYESLLEREVMGKRRPPSAQVQFELE